MADPNVETIASFVRTPYMTVGALDPVRLARRRMESDSLRSLPVVQGERYVGVIDWQTVRHLSGQELDLPVARYAREDIPTLTDNTTIAEAMSAFRTVNVVSHGLLPVLDRGRRLKGQLEREEFQGLMEDSSGNITVRKDPTAHLVTGPNVPRVGAKVISSNGKKLGTFQRHVEDRGRPRWIEVRHGILWKKRNRYVPLVAIDHQSPSEIVLTIESAIWATFKDRPRRE